jgi:hypothetical protein
MKPRNFPGRRERRRVRAAMTGVKRDYWPKDIRIRIGRAAHEKGGWS